MHDDQQYIEALRRNDAQGIRQIYERYAGQAIQWVTRNNGTVADAKDLFQETLIALYEKASDPSFTLSCPLGALLHVIYSRKWIDRLRQNKRDETVRKTEHLRYSAEWNEDAIVIAEETLEKEAQQKRLSAAFERLSDLCRQMLTLLSEGLAPKMVAERLQMNSVDTLYRRKNACMQRWRECYADISPR